MQNTDKIVTTVCGTLLCLLLLLRFGLNGNAQTRPVNAVQTGERSSPALPDSFSFATEAVPLNQWEVKERLDRELLFNSYNRAGIIYLLKLSARYFPIISERLAANGVPDDFKYLCIAESNLLAGAVSRVGATGFWQFMPDTAPGYGLEVSSQVDRRMELNALPMQPAAT